MSDCDQNLENAQSADVETRLAPTQFHPSRFENFKHVYPAVSRRAKGVSIGVNLSATKLCNFRCVYCQVDRGEKTRDALTRACESDAAPASRNVDMAILRAELESLARATLSGELFRLPRFAAASEDRRLLRDFAFSGDGEPTLSPQFPEAVDLLIDVRRELGYDPLKLVLITNATRLCVPSVAEALDRFCAANGEVWAKLDAWDQERLRTINRTGVRLETILDNILQASKRQRVKIQTALLRWRGESPSDAEWEKYCDILARLMSEGAVLESVQLYTVARVPAERDAEPLTDAEMDARAETVRRRLGLEVEVCYSK